jgi:hypothetical protein
MAIPYGAWLANQRQDSFYPSPAEKQIGAWLKEREGLFTNAFAAETALLYDQRSALDCELAKGLNRRHLDVGFPIFHDLCQALCDARLLYNVLYVSPDEPLTAERLAPFKRLVLPDAYSLSAADADAIRAWSRRGGVATAIGRTDPRLADIARAAPEAGEIVWEIRSAQTLVKAREVDGLGLSLHRTGGGYALHLVNYRLNDTTRCIETIPSAAFNLGWKPAQAVVHSFPASGASARLEGKTLTVGNLGLYTIVELG